MRLLLLLSALLAALSGAGASARAPQAQAVAVAARTSPAPAARAHAHVVPAVTCHLPTAEPAFLTVVLPTLPAPRLWADRQRE